MKLKCDHCGQAIPQANGIIADRDRMEVRYRDRVAYLTGHEFEMFQILLDRVGRVISKESFLTLIYQLDDDEPDMKIIDVFICKMRKKLKGMGFEVRTWWGRGYSLEVPQQETREEADVIDSSPDPEIEHARSEAG